MTPHEAYTAKDTFGIALHGKYLFLLTKAQPPETAIRLVHPNGVSTKAMHFKVARVLVIAAFDQTGMRNLAEYQGYVVDEQGDITNYISPNGQFWKMTYLGMDDGLKHPGIEWDSKLATLPLNIKDIR